MNKYPALTIVVPIYNESENLDRLYQELSAYMEKASTEVKVLMIDDGSVDDSLVMMREIVERDPRFSFISFTQNNGLSAAIKAGFDAVETPLTGYIDADLQTTPEDFELLLPLTPRHQLVTGVRSNRKDSFVKNMSSTIANGIRRAFTHDGMDDTGCPLKILHTDSAQKIPMFKGLHRFLPAMILLQKGEIVQVPVRHFERTAGTSNFGLWNRIFGPLSDCFAYLWMKRKYINYQLAEKG